MATFNFAINYNYQVSSEAEIDGVTDWETEVAEWFIKWGVLHYRLHGSDEFNTLELNVDNGDIDLKHPSGVYVEDEDYAIVDEK